MSRYPRLKGLATLASALLAACSAGGSTDKGSAPPPTAQPSRAENVAVSFSVHVPTSSAKSKARRTSTIPAVTQSIQIVVLDSANNPAVGSPFTLDTSASSPACVGGGASRTCSTQIGIPVGNDTITASAYDGPNGTGNLVASATVAQQIYLNATNTVGITLLTSVLADTITPARYASLSGNAITMSTDPTALATLSLSGGTGTYTVTPGCLPSIVTLTSSSYSIYQIGSGGYLGSCSITIGDGVTSLPPVSVNVVPVPSASPGMLVFCQTGAGYLQSVTISGGAPPFAIYTSPPFLTTAVINTNQVTAYATGSGTDSIVVRDSLLDSLTITASASNGC